MPSLIKPFKFINYETDKPWCNTKFVKQEKSVSLTMNEVSRKFFFVSPGLYEPANETRQNDEHYANDYDRPQLEAQRDQLLCENCAISSFTLHNITSLRGTK